jgi:hypothetical protein
MKYKLLLLIHIGIGFQCLFSQEQQNKIAFYDVSVITMKNAGAHEHQTVLVENNMIREIGKKDEVKIPNDYFKVNATGRYLMPGLADMHVHVFDTTELLLYLKNGITTVRNLHGTQGHLKWKKDIENKKLVSPYLYTSGPIIEEEPLSRRTNTIIGKHTDIDSLVQSQAAKGFDFIKIYDNISLDRYKQILESGKKYNIPIVGHVPTPVGVADVLKNNGQKSIEHFEELLPFFKNGRDTSGLQKFSREVARSNIWLTGTIDVYHSAMLQTQQPWSYFTALTGFNRMDADTRKIWNWEGAHRDRYRNQGADDYFTLTTHFFLQQLLPSLQRAGAKLLIGTDSPIPVLVHGYSLLDELILYTKSGLSNFEILQIATVNAASFLNKPVYNGTIEKGQRADLILLDQNPLKDLNNLRLLKGTYVNGFWLSEDFFK